VNPIMAIFKHIYVYKGVQNLLNQMKKIEYVSHR
jgi:hypothetical protein